MTAAELTITIVVFTIAAAMAVISIRSFRNKGFLFNNAYIYASKEERETVDKKPHYRQSAVVFLLLSLVFAVIGLSLVLKDGRIRLLEIPLVLGALVYAVVSSVKINREAKK